jgi:uncharacterized membrane protein YccC
MIGTRGGAISEARDRVVASDPGLTRLRMAISAMVGMSSTLVVEFFYAKATHAGAEGIIIAMLLGGVMAMMGSMALSGVEVWKKVRTAVFFPVAIGVGMLPGVAVAGHTDAMLTVFVAVMFVAVYVRRFGPAFFFYGFMLWMGYFFAAFLGAKFSSLPTLLGDVAVATVWALLLSVTLLRTHPRRALRRVQRAFGARARAVARACADVLEAGDDPRRRARAARRLHTRSLRLAEAALMVEAWSAERGTLAQGWSGPILRARVIDMQLAVDAIAQSATALAQEGGGLVAPAARIAGHLARREYPAARYAAGPLLTLPEIPGPAARAAYELAAAAVQFVTLATKTGVGVPAQDTAEAAETAAAADGIYGTGAADLLVGADLPDRFEVAALADEDFAPAAGLMMGALPGSAAVAGNIPARGGWNPLSRAKLSTRQAVQVAVAGALAIVLGRQISETRYYWAVIAAFITFTGTATRSESSIKAANRLLGTLVGLGVGIALADLTAGHTMWVLVVIVASMTCGFYLVTVSYACMIFFVTIMVAQLYSVLHEFTPGLLVLRLEETALGAAIGIAVGLVVLPTSTRDTIKAARQSFFESLAALLRATAARLAGDGPDEGDPAALTRALENQMRQLALVSRPLTRPLVWGVDPKLVRHRLTLYAAAARHTRALAAMPGRISDPGQAADLAESCRTLAETATLLSTDEPVEGARTEAGGFESAQATQATAESSTATRQPTADLYQLLTVLATLSSTHQPATHQSAQSTSVANASTKS